MPVTFHPAKHLADSITAPSFESTPERLLKLACPEASPKCAEVLQSSFRDPPGESLNNGSAILGSKNGFVWTIIDAYNHHHAISIRPDDVWIAILTQLSFYVNANAERLRSYFVEHEGKKQLTITLGGTRHTVDYGVFARMMTGLLRENVKDPEFCDWVLPGFSTTTQTDTIVSSVVLMATLKEYFTYMLRLRCGIPRVTLEGEKSDWENILERIEKLKEFGVETDRWYHLLRPVLSRFVSAFDDPEGEANLDFWSKVAHYEGGGSGPRFLAGWVNAFCVFNSKGQWLGDSSPNEAGGSSSRLSLRRKKSLSLKLDGVLYHRVDTNNVPPGYAEVPVKIDDNGQIFDATMVAGVVAQEVCDSGDSMLSKTGTKDVLKPVTGWWIVVNQETKEDVDGPLKYHSLE